MTTDPKPYLPKWKSLTLLLTLISSTALPTLAAASETAPALKVQAPKIKPSLVVPNAEEAKAQINKIPGGVDLVDEKEFKSQRAVTVKDMLDYVPGVFAQPKFGEDSRLSIRGSGLSRNFHLRGVRLLQDGVMINEADGGADFQEIDPLSLQYVEVYKGGNGLRYGAGTLGGAINYVTTTGRSAPGVLTRAEYGTWDYQRLQLGLGAVEGNYDIYVTPTVVRQNGFRDFSDQDNRRVNANIGAQLTDSIENRFYLIYNDIDQELPGNLDKNRALASPRSVLQNQKVGNQKRDMESYRLANKTTVLHGDWQTDVGVFMADKQLDHPIFQYLDIKSQNYGGNVRTAGSYKLAGFDNEASFGVNYVTGLVHDKRFVNNRGGKGAPTFYNRNRADNLEIFGENRLEVVEDFHFVAGLQYGLAKRKTEDQIKSDGNDTAARTYNYFNPEFGLVWDYQPDLQFFSGVSWSTEPPTFSELNPSTAVGLANLEAQEAITFELGTRGAKGDFAWDATYYYSWLDNELQQFDLGGGLTTTSNAKDTIHQGLELGGEWTALRGLIVEGTNGDSVKLRGAYTFSDFRFDNDPNFRDNKIPGAPVHYLRAEATYKHPSGFYIGPNVEWVPQGYHVDNINTEAQKTESYALLGARAGWEFEKYTLFIDGRNLTNEQYISNTSIATRASATSALYTPGDGLGVFAGVSVRW